MLEERAYRFLIPGSVFLLAYAAWLFVDPSLSLINLFREFYSKDAVALLAVGGGLIVIVLGHVISEFMFGFARPDPALRLDGEDTNKLWWHIRMRGTPQRNEDEIEALTLYTHGRLGAIAPDLKNYLGRSWSHMLVLSYSMSALVFAFIVWLLTLGYASLFTTRDEFAHRWFYADKFGGCEFFVRCITLLVGSAAMLWAFGRSIRRERAHRRKLYHMLLNGHLEALIAEDPDAAGMQK